MNIPFKELKHNLKHFDINEIAWQLGGQKKTMQRIANILEWFPSSIPDHVVLKKLVRIKNTWYFIPKENYKVESAEARKIILNCLNN